MDMSFADQALVAEWLWMNLKLETGVHNVPKEIDENVARLKLEGTGISKDELTSQQRRYIKSWKEGTL